MSELSIDLHWERGACPLRAGRYSNAHVVRYSDEHVLRADADRGGDPANTNPEQALAAALSSCHMMTFLALAGWPVAGYRDRAVAHLGRNACGRIAVTCIDLHPVVTFDASFAVEAGDLDRMQDRAHRYCFIANTLANDVEINIRQAS